MNRKTLTWLIADILAGMVLVALIFVGFQRFSGTTDKVRQLPPVVGSAAPEFNLTRLDGSPQSLSGLRGRAVMINFWATWCPPCKEEMPLLQRYAQKYPDKLVILGIDVAEEQKVVQPFITNGGFTYPILLDGEGLVADLYFVKNYPSSFFIDGGGVLRAQHVGLLSEDDLMKYLRTIGLE